MKRYIILILLSATLTSCESFLDIESDNLKESSKSFENIADLRAATAYLYCGPWIHFNSTSYTVFEGKANNMLADATNSAHYEYSLFFDNGSSQGYQELWNSLYNVINQSNAVINTYAPKARTHGLDAAKVNACEAEARFMRASAYWYLAMLWHDVPIIEDNKNHVLNTLIEPNWFEDVINYAINDLDYAIKWLFTTDEKGRATKYTAMAMQARVSLTAANYAMGNNFTERYLTRNEASSNAEIAQIYLEDVKTLTDAVILEGTQYGIMEDYEELWRVQNNNNEETLFGIQIVPLANSNYGNSRQDNFAGSSVLTGGLNAWGGSNYAAYDMVRMFIEYNGQSRTRANIFVKDQIYDYLATHTDLGYWKPTNTKCNVKKFVVGSSKDTDGIAINNNSGLINPLLRMAEVYLMYVEATMGLANETGDAVAMERFNKIRQRAFKANPADYTPYTTVTRDDMFKERRMEFFVETLFWQDIVRRSFFDLEWTCKFINNELMLDNPDTDLKNHRFYHYTLNNISGSWTNSPRPTNPEPTPNKAMHKMNGATYVHSQDADDNIWGAPYPQNESVNDYKLYNEPVNFNF